MKQLFFACIFAFCGLSLTRNNPNDNFSLGPKIGINFVNVNNEFTDINPGLVFGLTSTYSLNETSGIGVDLLYSANRSKAQMCRICVNLNLSQGSNFVQILQ
ncbi:MAG: hypothetical protein IPL23_28425 [Saprospiraceae bacterium]|nr:hypothetical protein [Saprospiraceae bacterium]